MATAEQMVNWRDAVNSSGAAPQTAGTTISTTGVGTFNQPDAFMFGYSFLNKPIMTYGCELDNYDPTNGQAIVSQGFTYGWITDDQGLYTGAYIGVRVLEGAVGAVATHDFHFREMAVKDALFTPNIPASYSIGAPGNPAPTDGTQLNISSISLVPTVAPSVSPAIVAYGMPSSIVLKSDLVDPTVQIEYHVSTSSFTPVQGNPATLIKTTRSMVEVVTALPNGTALQLATPYYFHAIAVNAAGSASPSAEVVQQLDPTAVATVVAQQIVSGFVLAGSIQVGNITLDPNNGIQIPLTNGGIISLPADGSSAQFIRVLLEATSLLVDDNFQLRGTLSQLIGTLTLAQGVVAPTVAPTVTTGGWDNPAVLFGLDATVPTTNSSGLWDDGTNWVTLKTTNTPIVVGFNKSTGVASTLLTETSAYTFIGIARSGTDWYLLSLDFNIHQYTVRKYNSSWVFQSTFTLPSVTSSAPAGIACDGTTLYVAYGRSTDSKVIIQSMTLTGGSPTTVVTTPTAFSFANVYTPRVCMTVGTADFGSQLFAVADTTGAYKLFNTTSGGTRVTADEWVAPNNEIQVGLYYDGTNFRALTTTNHIWKLSPIVTSVVRSVRFSYYDNNATGGTHETAWSPAKAITQTPRTWVRVSTPAPANNGGTDDPAAIRHYIQTTSGSYWLQPDITTSPWVGYYGVPLTSGTSAVSTPDFSAVSSPALFQSAAVDATPVPLTDLRGDGKFRIKGANLTETSFTPGWFNGGGSGLAIGNGSLVGSKRRFGDLMDCEVVLTRGSTTNVGTTYYTFTVGETFTDFNRVYGTGFVRQASSGTAYPCHVYAVDAQTVVLILSSGTTRVASAAAPITWASGDVISFGFQARIST